MPRYNVSAELTVDDRSPFAYVEADIKPPTSPFNPTTQENDQCAP